MRANDLADQGRDGAQGLAGAHGPPGAALEWPEAGAQGLPELLGPQGAAAGRLLAGAQGLAPPWPEAGAHGLPRIAGRPGAQGLPGPQGLRMFCASCIGFSAAATGVGAGAVAAIAAAMVERPPASRAVFIRMIGIKRFSFIWFGC
jgi:hypothetical protein